MRGKIVKALKYGFIAAYVGYTSYLHYQQYKFNEVVKNVTYQLYVNDYQLANALKALISKISVNL